MYTRTVRLQDTDAAGVVYFTSALDICHEAFEDALMGAGIDIRTFFSNPDTAMPVVHANIDFLRPSFCGDQLVVQLSTHQLAEDDFEVRYTITAVNKGERIVAKAMIRHVCINPINRQRKPLPKEMVTWIQRWSLAMS
ncbi:thioesterase family protein [Acaryochloris sp. IP29b_bin.148]|uniref:acyl-CoA thioesterase n=1 Tax=Acaryochloris sp. IP29b_bin.148 TaxID=2969218 RepID=UPI002610D572|nr:thioesterase family protein [Acaryochloris sp. IP29b_bin.148]